MKEQSRQTIFNLESGLYLAPPLEGDLRDCKARQLKSARCGLATFP